MAEKLNKFPLSMTILMHNHYTLANSKMSKSKGNVVCPVELITKFGLSAVRFYFLAFGPLNRDVEFAEDQILPTYHKFMADKLVNTALRLSNPKFNDDNQFNHIEYFPSEWEKKVTRFEEINKKIESELNKFNFQSAFVLIAEALDEMNVIVQDSQFWNGKTEFKDVSCFIYAEMRIILLFLKPFSPQLVEALWKFLGFTDLSLSFQKKGVFYKIEQELRETVIIKK